eukprot:gene6463-7492_t
MDSTAQGGPDEVVTLVVKHRIKPGLEADYEAWLRRIVRIAGERPGHLGVDVVRSKQGGLALFTCVLRYRSTEDLERWLDSPQRLELINQAAPMLADGDQTEVGAVNEFWFSPLADAAANGHAAGDPAADVAGADHLGPGTAAAPVPVQLHRRHLPGHPDHRCTGGLPADAGGHPPVRALA